MSAEASRERGTADAAAHGDSAGRQGSRRTPEGEVRSQRADPGEIPPDAREARFRTDVSPRILFYALLGFFAAIAASAGFVALVLWAMSATVTRAPLDSLAARKLAPPAPRLESCSVAIVPPSRRARKRGLPAMARSRRAEPASQSSVRWSSWRRMAGPNPTRRRPKQAGRIRALDGGGRAMKAAALLAPRDRKLHRRSGGEAVRPVRRRDDRAETRRANPARSRIPRRAGQDRHRCARSAAASRSCSRPCCTIARTSAG